MDLELIAAFPSLMEAQVACSALRAAGVAAQVMDQNYSSIFPTAHIGGFRVAAIVIACSRLRRPVEARLPRGLDDFLILFQIKHRLLADAGEIALLAAGSRVAR